MYDIADIDDSKRYHVSDKQIAVLDLPNSIKKLSKGEEVLAVYPETTSFYPAVVVQSAKRNLNSLEPTVTVQFQGDANEQGTLSYFFFIIDYSYSFQFLFVSVYYIGQTPNIIVPLSHIIRPPEDWILR
jgi:hypothetical protein